MSIEVIILIIGILIILLLAEITIRSSLRLAHHFKWSGTFVGLTILSIGTSIPEIMTAIVGSIDILKQPSAINAISGLIVGTNVGSDIFQQSFILPVIGLFGMIVVVKKNLFLEVGALVIGTALMWVMVLNGFLGRIEGLILVLVYVGYLIYLGKKQSKKEKLIKHRSNRIVEKDHFSKKRIASEIALILFGFAFMGLATNAVINSATVLVAMLPISASFFGVILLGVASALPEFTTALITIFKHEKEVSAGVLIGSNVANPLLGLGLGSLISGYTIPNVVRLYDLPMKIGIALLIFFFLWRNEKLNKWEAVVLLVVFFVYLALRQIYFPVDF
ncbi:MAG: hypothetical protein ABIH82_05470 [Candidatus Woesearchaeota archaeon]